MNERLRDLVRQAGLDDPDFPIEDWDNVPLAKFAQLIVRECIQVCIADISDPRDTIEHKCAKKIKEHFGINNEPTTNIPHHPKYDYFP